MVSSNVVVVIPGGNGRAWADEIQRQSPDTIVQVWPEIIAPAAVATAICWNQPEGFLGTLPNLKLAASLGAGVDHLLSDSSVRDQTYISRVVDRSLADQMSKYVLTMVMGLERGLISRMADQHNAPWNETVEPQSPVVGVLGMGNLGNAIFQRLQLNGYPVYGFRRSPSDNDRVFSGSEGLTELCKKVNTIVCCLPLTAQTQNILNRRFFERLGQGTILINIGRGAHLVEEDLIPAIESGQIKHAVLDVFRTEPLPAGHPFWHHPQITVTPHIAATNDRSIAVTQILESHLLVLNDKPPINLVDRTRGY
jgi:glyoxylate/hydroxypyruvate reductase A